MFEISIQGWYLILILAPLLGCLIAGLLAHVIGNKNAHRAAILGLLVSFGAAVKLAIPQLSQNISPVNHNLYAWAISGSFQFYIGYLLDRLTCIMILVVTFVSLLVHIYSIGYMEGDKGYARFFSYMSLFTFFMLMLVTANNFMQLFFGWEGVGLVSYLLIGFWHHKDSANEGSLKAFLINRVGDFGFILGIAAVLDYFNTLDYASVFSQVGQFANTTIALLPGEHFHLLTVISILLFIGAMGKSAQVPLHVWLPESMEGPTPISALIHAATMVTAGIFMLARISPIIEYAPVALSFVMIIGATGALFTGLIAIVQNDIKRVVAYSTLSQLGYMIAAAGASAFSASIFHLVTHAFFKALLFLGAGSVILGMHHEQDMRKMGGLWKYMPITYVTFLIGSLALVAIPPFSGFYSKDVLIEVEAASTLFGSTYAYYCLYIGAFVTALYTFRAFFMTFHGKPRFDEHTRSHLRESSWVVCLPLVLLAIPSVLAGLVWSSAFVFDNNYLLNHGIVVAPEYNVLPHIAKELLSPTAMALSAYQHSVFWLTVTGIFVAWFAYIQFPQLPEWVSQKFKPFYLVLVWKYGFDEFNQLVWVDGTRKVSSKLYEISDMKLIDGWMINGSGRMVARIAAIARKFQTGFLYHYIFIMLIGFVGLIWWLLK